MEQELKLLNSSISDLNWFKENSKEIRKKHEGKFVAIKDSSIKEVAKDVELLIKKLDKKGIESNFVLIKYVTPKGVISIL
ncbi:MAG: hypothetical protein KKA61_02155 [Nanoarchaeota archaeon]|nr:hypothetical protein [Nanoarchaeota archaeon]MBU4283948.1 hypothetical protein [Nanoarchaeota archaeon]MBU4493147.1 hypothetical protein [Nanoarchaeota archaeon]